VLVGIGAVASVLVLSVAGAAADGLVTGSSTTSSSTPTPTTATSPNAPAGGGGGKNIVQIQNRTDGSLRVDGRVDLSVAPGPNIAPVNMATALSSCKNCQTLAMALQVVMISSHTQYARPQNSAVAVNFACSGCTTIAVAYQYALTVDDPTQVPDSARRLVAQMKSELAGVQGTPGITLAQAEARFNAVIAQYQELIGNLDKQRQETSEDDTPNATPPPSASPGASPAAGASPSAAGSDGATPSPTASPTPSPSPSGSP
jgi:hypothetical protein